MSFNFGAEPVAGGSSFKKPNVGKHGARLRSILHLGLFEDSFEGKKKAAAPFVSAVFELKEDDDRNEDGAPLFIAKNFPLRKGSKAFLTTFMKTMLTPEEYVQYEADTLQGGFEDLIGRPCELDLEGSKDKNEDGTPKYVNIKTISKLHDKLVAILDPLEVTGAGHCVMGSHTKDSVMEINPYTVRTVLMQSVNYPGSAAESAVAEVLKEHPDLYSAKASDKDKGAASKKEEVPDAPPPELDSKEEF